MWDWLRDGAVGIMPFAVIWLAFRIEQLARQIDTCTRLIQLELARNDEERESELLAEWKAEREDRRKDTRRVLITWGILGAVVLAIWVFLSAGR